jgi:hypothetical protein
MPALHNHTRHTPDDRVSQTYTLGRPSHDLLRWSSHALSLLSGGLTTPAIGHGEGRKGADYPNDRSGKAAAALLPPGTQGPRTPWNLAQTRPSLAPGASHIPYPTRSNEALRHESQARQNSDQGGMRGRGRETRFWPTNKPPHSLRDRYTRDGPPKRNPQRREAARTWGG